MNKENLFTAIGWTLFVGIVAVLIVWGIILMRHNIQKVAEGHCADLGKRLAYETELIGRYCYIKVRPGLKVREDRVLDFLPVIDCR